MVSILSGVMNEGFGIAVFFDTFIGDGGTFA
jgi:hypothetical protein